MLPPYRGFRDVLTRLAMSTAVLVVMLIGSLPADAEVGSGRIITPRAGEILTAGQLLSITWDGVPAGSEELELLLLSDGSDGYLRLTRMLHPQTRSFAWRVPNLPPVRARLQIRYGRDGVEHGCEPSRPFFIEPSLGMPVSTIVLRAGEWWLGVHHGLTAMTVALTGGNDDERIAAQYPSRATAVLPTGPECVSNPSLPTNGREPGSLHSEQRREERYGLPRQPMDVPLRP